MGIFQPWGSKGSLSFFILAVLSLWVELIYLKKASAEHNRVKEAEIVRNLIRHQRHDWMNHVQVIMGYQMLKQYQKMTTYLQKMTTKASQDRTISDLDYPPLSAFLLTMDYDYPHWNWQVTLDRSIALFSLEKQKQLFQVIHVLLPWIMKQIEKKIAWTDIDLNLFLKNNHLTFSFRFISKDNVSSDNETVNWGQLPKKLRQCKATCEWSEKEHQLSVQIPKLSTVKRR